MLFIYFNSPDIAFFRASEQPLGKQEGKKRGRGRQRTDQLVETLGGQN